MLGFDPARAPAGVPRADRRRPPAGGAVLEPHRARDARDVRALLPAARATSTRRSGSSGSRRSATRCAKTLSGGQKRRLDLGVALVGDPDLLFLDEPTTGFDPAARRAAWEMIRSLRSLGKTILLTTHYLDEAQQLCDRVAVLRAGEIVRLGTPDELRAGRRRGGDPLRPRRQRGRPPDARADPDAPRADRRRPWPTGGSSRALEVRRPSLEDVYLALLDEEEAREHLSSTRCAPSSSSSGGAARRRSSSSSSR